jgi:hypothetical protein
MSRLFFDDVSVQGSAEDETMRNSTYCDANQCRRTTYIPGIGKLLPSFYA